MKSAPFEHDKFYHVFNQGNNKENIFKEAKNYFHFLKLMKRYLLPIAEIYCYCLMPNHFHFVLRIKGNEQIDGDLRQKKLHQSFSNLFIELGVLSI